MAWTLADAAITAARDEFASAVVYTPALGGGPFSFDAILDRPYEGVIVGGSDVELAARRPVLDVRLADLDDGDTAPLAGDTMTIDGVGTWTVEELEPDGRGGVKLFLTGPA